MTRLSFFLRRKQGLSIKDFQSYWLSHHGPLVAKLAEQLHIEKYIQVHTLNIPMNSALADARGGMEQPYDGVAEFWWPSSNALLDSFQSSENRAAISELLADEKEFIDLANSPFWLAEEYPIIQPAISKVASIDSTLLKIVFPIRKLLTLNEENARHYWLKKHALLIQHHQNTSGILQYQQNHRVSHPLEDTLRHRRGTTAEPYLGNAEVWVESERPGSAEAAEANRLAIADEREFIDFQRSSMWAAKEFIIVDNTLTLNPR